MKKFLKILLSVAVCTVLTLSAVCCGGNTDGASSAVTPIDNSKLLMTVACLSDLHNQHSLIDSDTPHLRPDVVTTLTAMKEQEEKVDLVLIGGDVSSDSRVPESSINTILTELKTNVDALNAKMLLVSGNHDYHAGQGDEHVYNSADYYGFYMKENIGELKGDDGYFESHYGEDYLLGYHYFINGFDFIGISTSPSDMKANEGHYKYSSGTFDWLESKLKSIGKDKTVFLLAHLPIEDSNSLLEDKGLVEESSERMLGICKNYPNLLYIYGHDHANDSAYIWNNTVERVTVYDENGAIIGGGRNQNKISSLNDKIVWRLKETGGRYSIQNVESGEYLTVDGSSLALSGSQHFWRISGNSGAAVIKSISTGKHIFYDDALSAYSLADNANYGLSFYEKSVDESGEASFTYTDTVKDGGEYVILVSGMNRALLNEVHISGENCVAAVDVGVENGSLFYVGDGTDANEPKVGFTSTFMGSMRYYNNSINGMIGDGNPDIVQALMIYVYADRIVLQMKNYGNVNGGSDLPAPYNVPRSNAAAVQTVLLDPRALESLTKGALL